MKWRCRKYWLIPRGSPHLGQDPPPGAFSGEQGSAGTSVSVRSPPRGPSRSQGRQPREESWACVRASRARGCVRTPPPEAVRARRRAPGAGSPLSPRMICHCLMRLMSPGDGMQGAGALIRSRCSWEWWQVGAWARGRAVHPPGGFH